MGKGKHPAFSIDVNDRINSSDVTFCHSYSYIVVVINACPTEVSFASPALKARTLQIHPVQVNIDATL